MTSPLERLTGTGKPLAAEPPDAKEFEGLKRSGLARLKDATNADSESPVATATRASLGAKPAPVLPGPQRSSPRE